MIAANVASDVGEVTMQVSEGMSEVVLTIGPDHTLRQAAESMVQRNVGAAVVVDPDEQGPGVLTERDILRAVGSGKDPDSERVGDHLTSNLKFAHPDWSLEEAASAMIRGSFRHLVVVEGADLVGVLSMRDIVRCWTQDGSTSEVPAASSA
jgi:CBS domain-containing protein